MMAYSGQKLVANISNNKIKR